MRALAAAVYAVVDELSDVHVEALARACRGLTVSTSAVAQAVPVAQRDVVQPLVQAWNASTGTSGESVALALETALVSRRAIAAVAIDVVVTGPDSPAAPVRLTSEVVRQLIDQAKQRVTLVSFSAYRMPPIIAALDAADARGVRVEVILESPDHLDGGGGGAAYARYATYYWPNDERSPPDAKLHAKAVIVDARDVLLTSANMTNAAYDKNIELGVLCRGGDTAKKIQQHFDALIARGVLRLA